MYRRLGGKGQRGDAVMSKVLPVLVYQPHVASEHDIEKFGQRKEVIEMGRIFLVPEHRGDTAMATTVQQLDNLGARAGCAGELELPISAVAIPCRLNENEVDQVQLRCPSKSVQWDRLPFVAEAHR